MMPKSVQSIFYLNTKTKKLFKGYVMKGISPIIATILMLMITIALAGTAYLYISGAFERQIQGIELVDSYCTGGTVSFVIRNLGTTPITTLTCSQTAPAGDTCSFSGVNIAPGGTQTLTDTCSGSGGRSCVYRITPPVGRSIQATVFCS